MSTLFTRHVYLPVLDRLKGVPFRQALTALRRNEGRSREDLAALQAEAVQRLIEHAAACSPYYAEALRSAGLAPEDFRDLSALAELPLLDKTTLLDRQDEIRAAAHPGKRLRGSTSGSTGISMTFEFDSIHRAYAEASLWRHRGWWGLRRGEREANLWGRPMGLEGWREALQGFKYSLRNVRNHYTFDDFSPARMAEIARNLRAFRPRLVYGYGSSIGRLARFLAERDERLAEGERPVLVEYTADHLPASEREIAREVFGAPVTSQYGASEVPGVAGQCPRGGMHVSIDHCVVEFLRPDGSPAEPAEPAEIVLTSLYNYAMPLIRYRVGDIGAASAGECPCGIALPLMELTIGKTVDLIRTSAVSGVSAHFLDYANLLLMREGIAGIRQFFVEQVGRDEFRLDYISDGAPPERALGVFGDLMEERLGSQIQVDFRRVSEIPMPPSGKRRYFRGLADG